MATKLLIFGITGDLSRRKLLPALRQIIAANEFTDGEIIGVSRREVSDEIFGDIAHHGHIFTMNIKSQAEYSRLRNHVNLQKDDQLLVYLAVPPAAATGIVDHLGEAGMCDRRVKILFEKPFGVNYASAQNMIHRTGRYFKDDQIYRIDHYMAKEMAQNIVAFRSYNALFSHLWNSEAIEKIEISAYEHIGIEERGEFYEQTGALRDVVQGHLMQLLALIIMKVPANLDWNKIPKSRTMALQSLLPVDPRESFRAQYEGYLQEIDKEISCTETFVRMVLHSKDIMWKNVPFILTTGKALSKKTTEIRVFFKKTQTCQTNILTFHVQPHEGVEVALQVKKPGYERAFEEKSLRFGYPEDTRLPDAYEQVIVDAIHSRKSLFTSSDEVLESWRVLQPLVDEWSHCVEERLYCYPQGSDPKDIHKV